MVSSESSAEVEVASFEVVSFEVANTLEGAFPMVDVINEQTGEVVYSHYIATDFFHPAVEYGKAIFKAECDMFF